MILVDTSVLIDYFRGIENPKARLLAKVFERDIPFGLSAFTVQELLLAMTAISRKLPLLHNDRDFDSIASATEELRKLKTKKEPVP